MKLKRILSIILTISIIATSFSSVVQISAQTEEGTSIQAAQVTAAEEIAVQTESRPIESIYEFVINNKEKFSVFMTTPVLWISNYKITLTCDIDMKGKVFNSIKEFGGVFDGCGHTVSNLKIQNKSDKSKNSELAFINTVNEFAEIKNITFDNYKVEGKSSIKKAAGLALINHGTVSGVDIINGSINNIDKKAKSAGFVLNNEEDGVIENCHMENMSAKDSNIRSGFVETNYGKIINCSTTLSVDNKDIASGFVIENLGIIEKCSFKGDVSSKKYAGGFCGSNSGEITYCKAEGNVTAKTKSTKLATICGGFVGENSGTIKNCSSTKKVEGQEFTGGFAGINNYEGEIINCKTICDVKSHTYVASIYCGGFVGVDAGKIEDCSFEGKVDGCVDSEKVVGIVVGVTLAVIAIVAIIVMIYSLMKMHEADSNLNEVTNELNQVIDIAYKKYYNILKNTEGDYIVEKLDNFEGAEVANILENFGMNYWQYNQDKRISYLAVFKCVSINIHNMLIKEQSGNITPNQFCDIMYNKIFDENGKVKSDLITKIYNNIYNCVIAENNIIIKSLNKYNNAINVGDKGFIISLITTFVGGATSGFSTRFTAGCKFANVAGFCGFNVGEITGCRANIDSFKAKTLYNRHNVCGGFVGTNGETGTIKDCNTTGNEIHNKTYTGGHLGGFVGDNFGKIENGTTTISVANGKCTGGFCGSNSGEISGSKSEGNATTDAKTLTNKTKCGGFVGNNDEKGKIYDCTSSGSVTGQEYVGGFCGDNSGEVSKSKSSGDATAKTVGNANICGGFVGNNDEKGNIDSCTSTGNATGQEYVGGFAGVNKSEIIDCNAHGKVTAKTKIHTALAGGFVGENERGTIISCTAIGGADSRSSSGQAKAGGFVGVNKANIMSSKASGYVYLSAGTCHKDDGCGGFVGRNDKDGSIDGCYAEAIVETTNKKKGGGFVGEALSKSTINNSKCKSKIITKAGIKSQIKFYQDKDKKAVIENCNIN